MKNYTDVTVLLDRSGSIETIRKDLEGAFAAFLNSQRALGGETRFSLYQFDNTMSQIYQALPLHEVPELKINPRGGTALIDATVQAIDSTGFRLSQLAESERPTRVVFISLTDGEENSSTRFTLQQAKDRVTEQQNKYNWQFLYLGANQDAYKVGSGYGLAGNTTLSYAATPDGINTMTRSLCAAVGSYHVGSAVNCSFTPQDQTVIKELHEYDKAYTTLPSKPTPDFASTGNVKFSSSGLNYFAS